MRDCNIQGYNLSLLTSKICLFLKIIFQQNKIIMRIISTVITALLIIIFNGLIAQQLTVNSSGDTINITDSNHLRQGEWILPRGMVYETGNYVDNKKDGIWIFYGVTEKPQLLEEYKGGKLNGISLVFDEKGNIRNERHFKDGKLEGLNVFYSHEGIKLMKRYYKNGLLHGYFYKYYDNGKLMEKSYYWQDKKDSISTFYNESEQLLALIHYKKGMLHGVYKTFYDNGILKSEKIYINNLAQGNYYEYHDNSRIKIQGQYLNDAKTGRWTYFDINNKKIKIEDYKDGEPIKTKIF